MENKDIKEKIFTIQYRDYNEDDSVWESFVENRSYDYCDGYIDCSNETDDNNIYRVINQLTKEVVEELSYEEYDEKQRY